MEQNATGKLVVKKSNLEQQLRSDGKAQIFSVLYFFCDFSQIELHLVLNHP